MKGYYGQSRVCVSNKLIDLLRYFMPYTTFSSITDNLMTKFHALVIIRSHKT